MIYLFAFSTALSVGAVVALLAGMAPVRPKGVQRRLVEIGMDSKAEVRQRRRVERRSKVDALLEEVGSQFEARYPRSGAVRRGLTAAGYRNRNAVAYYWGIRLTLTALLGGGTFILIPALGGRPAIALLLGLYFGGIGWSFPALSVMLKRRRRQKEIQRALADALDLLVVCVEAGLGLNQALQRVAREIVAMSPEMSKELILVNLEIRAGTPRAEALMNLADRTDMADLRSLATMLVQADRFGTSIAQSLRLHADTLREKRRQKAEEAAAKTTIKMVFPLVICIFPALFVVILVPGLMMIVESLGAIG